MSEPLIVTSFETQRVLGIDDDRATLAATEAMRSTSSVASVVKAVGALGALNLLADSNSCVRKRVSKDSRTKATHRALNRTPALTAAEASAAVVLAPQA